MKFNNVELNLETIEKTRLWFYDNAFDCIEEVTTGKVKVNNLKEYIDWQKQRAEQALTGDFDYTFTFMQRAYFIQTGKDVALLS